MAMNLKDWLSQGKGRHKALTRELRLSPGRITQMAQSGVPAKYMLAVRDFTDGVVTLEEMAEERAAPMQEAA